MKKSAALLGLFTVGWAGACAWAAPPPIVIEAELPAETVGESDTDGSTASTRIERARFEGRYTSVAEVIENEAGVQVRSTGTLGGYATVMLRGASEQQVLVLLDGVPLNAAAGGGVDLGQFHLTDVEAIEIYRGATPVQFGAAGLGGALNIRTLRHRDVTSGRVTLRAGSFDSYGANAQLFLVPNPVWDAVLAANAETGKNDFRYVNKNRPFDPTDPNRERRDPRHNAQVDRIGLLGKLGYTPQSSRRLDVTANLLLQEQGLPTADNNPAAQTEFRNGQLHLQGQWAERQLAGSAWDTRLRGYFGGLSEEYDDRAGQVGLGQQHTHDRTLAYGLYSYGERPVLWGRWRNSLEWRGEDYRSRDLSQHRNAPGAARDQVNLASEWQLALLTGRLELTPAVRGLYRADDFGSRAQGQRGGHMNPQLGARLLLTQDVALRSNAGQYTRLPSFFELFGDRGFITGNPGLKAERGLNLDIGAEYRFLPAGGWLQRADVGVGFFHNTAEDTIAFIYDARGVGRASNVGASRILGLEAEARLAWASRTRLEMNATWQDPENRGDVAAFRGKRLPGRFRESLNLRLEQDIASASLWYSFHGERGLFYDSANLLPTKTRAEHNVGAGYRLKSFRIDAEARNLGNANYQSFNGFPEPGRSYWLSLSYLYP